VKRGVWRAVLLLAATAQADPYEAYIKTSRDFKPVRMDPAVAWKAYPSWTYMPWYYQWSIGYDDAAARFCAETGINGGFSDWGNTAHLAWMEQHQLRFYVDHVAGKGDLHLWDHLPKDKADVDRIHGTGFRTRPVNAGMKAKLERVIREHLAGVKQSPVRAAYALDDEISWGSFVHPTMWQITDDTAAFPAWLNEVYGGQAPQYNGWISYEQIRQKLAGWSVEAFDVSQLMDQWTFNDSYWNNFIGDLVAHANSIDPATPCGYVGGQCPNAFGGYDYAKLMRKVQYLEAYNMAGAQAIVRSLNPSNAIPSVTTFFYKDTPDAAWQVWYYLAQGNRGHIAWVENWFDGKVPKPWLNDLAATYKEAGATIGPLMSNAQFRHDGVALYYSHASIQLGWILDAVAHGRTWVNRNNDHILGSSHLNRMAWMNMLRDEGLQFIWLDYASVIQDGIPPHVKVLILPHTLCLSDVEAQRIRAFCEAGGTVIADYLPGLWDQHGKGRAGGGALDTMFGIRHDPKMTAKDVFQGDGKLWCEVDQDVHYNDKNPEDLLRDNACLMDVAGFHKVARMMPTLQSNAYGKGKAVLMNLSPMWYLAYRRQGAASASKRGVFMRPIHDAGLSRWVRVETPDNKAFGYEITYWEKGGRTILFLFMNADISVGSAGGGESLGLKTDVLPVTLAFGKPIFNVRDERTGEALGAGQRFQLRWKQNEACVLSFAEAGN